MSKGELELVRWLAGAVKSRPGLSSDGSQNRVAIDIGDDMAGLRLSDGQLLLLSSDMIVDGTHFDRKIHKPEAIGRKALCCCLSDVAAMAAKPLAALVSLALPKDEVFEIGRPLLSGLMAAADEFECPVVGGDTTSWNDRLVVDVALVAEPWPDCQAVTRKDAQPGDLLVVTGRLGGSRLGKHLDFTPRLAEARQLVQTLGDDLHAMIDITDGLSLDLSRLCAASACGATISETALQSVIAADARTAAGEDGRSALQHALSDGEDFELLFAVAPQAESKLHSLDFDLHVIGQVSHEGLTIEDSAGQSMPLQPEGYEH